MVIGLAVELTFCYAMLNPSKDLCHVLLVYFLLLGSLGRLEPGITGKPAAAPLAGALGIVAVVMLVAMVAAVDLVVLRVRFTHSFGSLISCHITTSQVLSLQYSSSNFACCSL